MILKLTAALAAALTLPLAARGGEPVAAPRTAAPATTFDDAAFLRTVAKCGLYDVCLSNHVGPVTRNSDVKSFAACVVANHIIASNALKAIAKDAGVELPTKLDDLHQRQFDAFRDYKGDNLERDYVKAMAARLTVAVAAFTRASKEANDPALREFAEAALPGLRKHLETVKALDR